MVAFNLRMPAGIAGNLNRNGAGSTVEAQIIMPTNPPTFYGMGVVMDNAAGQIRPPTTGDVIYGLYIRPYPTQAGQDPLGTDTPPTSGEASICKRGYVSVLLRGAAPAVKGAAANVWIAAAAGGEVPGGITAATGANVVALGGYFTGAADAQGFTEVAYNL